MHSWQEQKPINSNQIPGLFSIMMEKTERDQFYLVLTISKFKTFAPLICSAKLSLLIR